MPLHSRAFPVAVHGAGRGGRQPHPRQRGSPRGWHGAATRGAGRGSRGAPRPRWPAIVLPPRRLLLRRWQRKGTEKKGAQGLRSPSTEPAPCAPGRMEEGAWARGGTPPMPHATLPVPPTPIRARPRSPRPGSRSTQRPIVRQYASRTPPRTRSFLLASRSGSGCPAPAPPQAPPSSSRLARSSRRGEQGRGRWPHRDTPPRRPAHHPGAPRLRPCAAADHLG